jgi:hypothetical protein
MGGNSAIGGNGGNGGRRTVPAEGSGSVTRQNDPVNGGGSVADPRRRPDRQPEGGSSAGAESQNDGRRPESITPPVRTGETVRSQPQLERRDPSREPESQPETRDQPQPEPARENPRREEPRREQPRNGTYQGPDRPRVVRPPEPERAQPSAQPQGESRPQAQPQTREPERRAEPRSEPKHAPVQKPQDPEESGRRPN